MYDHLLPTEPSYVSNKPLSKPVPYLSNYEPEKLDNSWIIPIFKLMDKITGVCSKLWAKKQK